MVNVPRPLALRKTSIRRAIALTAAMALVTPTGIGMLAGPAAAAKPLQAPVEQRWESVSGPPAGPVVVREPDFGEPFVAPRVDWPAAGSAVVDLDAVRTPGARAGAGRVRAGGLPVLVAREGGGPSRVRLVLTDRSAAARAGVNGLLLSAAPADNAVAGGRVRVWVDPSTIAGEFGGDWARRLKLVALPACALTSPQAAGCREQTPLAWGRDGDLLSAAVDVPAGKAGSTGGSGSAVVFAVVAGAGGDAGDFSATPLKPSGSWTAGGSSGDFGYSYPIEVPPVPGGLDPSVELSYSSQSVDGEQVSTNNQSSEVGDGWDMSPGYVERHYQSCDEVPNATWPKTADSCWSGPVVNVSFGAGSGDLVYDAGVSTKWRLSSDNGARVELKTGADNGAKNGEYWKITTQDGTQYFFGLNRLPGSGAPVTNSAWTQRVYSPRSGDPCYSSAGFASSFCDMAYKWNLDYVVDPHKNAMAYFYGKEIGYYGPNKGFAPVAYDRGGWLDHIDYGLRDPNPYAAKASARVQFSYSERCVESSTVCAPGNIDQQKEKWPDTPWDLNCKSSGECYMHSVTFWSRLRLTGIQTQIFNGSGYTTVDKYALTQTFPDPGDGTSPALWLGSIQHSAGGITLPAVTFEPMKLPNRADGLDGAPAMNHNRISTITTETGEVIGVSYHTECAAPVSLAPESNTKLCYPVYWTKEGADSATRDWFHKYVVDEITDQDPTGGATPEATTYEYLDGGAWAFDDGELVKDKHRTYGQWRGFGRVVTRTGAGVDAKTKAENVYYRGMDGDRLPNNGRRSASVSLSPAVTVPGAAVMVPDNKDLAGQVREAITYNGDGGPVDSATVNDYWVGAATATRKRPALIGDLTAQFVRTASVKTTTAVTSTNPTSWRTTRTDTTHSTALGLPTVIYDYGDIGQPSQATCRVSTYAPTDLNAYIADRVATSESFALPCGGSGINGQTAPATVNRPADVITSTRTFYDVPTYDTSTWPQAAPTTGDVNVIQQTTETGWIVATKTKNDAYGRPAESYDSNGNKTTMTYTMTNGLTTSVQELNPLSHKSTKVLDPARGLELKETDANNQTTTQTYDALGRLTGVWLPGRALNQGANEKFAYTVSQSSPSTITTSTLNNDESYRVSVEFFDALARPRQTQSTSPTGGRLVTDTYYDSHGWAVKVSNTYHDTTSGPVTTMLDMKGKDQLIPNQDLLVYDGLGRKTVVISQSKGQVKWQTRTVFGGDRTTTIPPNGGTPTTTIVDARGRTTELWNYTSMPTVAGSVVSGGSPVKITYGYDRRGKQNRITDDQGNAWITEYDVRGRATIKTDPDAGRRQMTYDNNGNVTSSTDALGRTISTTYDALGRRTGVYDGPTSASPPRATWTYDSTTITNGIGQVASETSYNDGLPYTSKPAGYNERGQSLGTTITIPSSAANGLLAGAYTFTNEYTTVSGLLSKTTYPAGGGLPAETVNHTYTATDLPTGIGSSLGDYIDSTKYTPYGQVSQSKFGFGTTNVAWATYIYDEHSQRLKNTYIDRTGTGTTRTNDVVYTYNDAGRILKIDDARSSGASKETQCFRYDLLGRLTTAWTATDNCAADLSTGGSNATVGGISPYWTSWTYNSVGGRTKEVQHALPGGSADTTTTYTYPAAGSAQPHTVRSETVTGPAGTKTRTFEYDAVGNNTTRTTPEHGAQTLTWDSDGRLKAVAAGATANASYAYTGDGTILLQWDPSAKTATLYLPGQELTLNTATNSVSGKRYYTGPDGTTCVRTGTTNTAYNYLINDRLGTATLSLDNNGSNPRWRAYTPYGAPRGTQPTDWPDTHGYLGKPTDDATGLTILGARHYDPVAGRFISLDPVLNPDDPNQIGGYTYAGDDPVNRSDPTGTNAYDEQTPCAHYDCGANNVDRSPDATENATNNAKNGWHSTYKPKPKPAGPPPKKKKKCGFLCKAKKGFDKSLRWANEGRQWVSDHWDKIELGLAVVGLGVCVLASAGACLVVGAVTVGLNVAEDLTDGDGEFNWKRHALDAALVGGGGAADRVAAKSAKAFWKETPFSFRSGNAQKDMDALRGGTRTEVAAKAVRGGVNKLPGRARSAVYAGSDLAGNATAVIHPLNYAVARVKNAVNTLNGGRTMRQITKNYVLWGTRNNWYTGAYDYAVHGGGEHE